MKIIWKSYPEAVASTFTAMGNNSNTREELDKIVRDAEKEKEVGFIEGTQNFMGFISDVREDGLSHAIYGKPFSQVMGEFFKELGHDIGLFILGNGDLFFLLPAVFLICCTFFVGRNKYTKWIIPLCFTYFVSRVFFRMII